MKFTGQTDQKTGRRPNRCDVYNLGIDYDFIPAYNIKMAAGRNFSKQFGTDKKAVILNENAATLLGFKDAASAINQENIRGRPRYRYRCRSYSKFSSIGVAENH